MALPAAYEKSNYILVVSFFDEEGAPVVPDEATWTWTDRNGLVINGRQGVLIEPLAAVVNIVLSGNDLSIGVSRNRIRILTIKGTYTSDTFGLLPVTGQVKISVEDLVAVS